MILKENYKKCHLSEKKPLRPPAPIRKHPLTGGGYASNGSQKEQMAAARQSERLKK